MKTLTDAGVASVTDVGPRFVSQLGRSLVIASYRFSELVAANCVCVRTFGLARGPLSAARGPAHAAATQVAAAITPRVERMSGLYGNGMRTASRSGDGGGGGGPSEPGFGSPH